MQIFRENEICIRPSWQEWRKVLKTEGARYHQSQKRENFKGFAFPSPNKLGVHVHLCIPFSAIPAIALSDLQTFEYHKNWAFYQTPIHSPEAT